MRKKKIVILTVTPIVLIGMLASYLFWANQRADYYANISNEASNKQEKILNLEKSLALWKKTGNILTLADLYISTGNSNLAKQIMVGRGEVDILNKLGNLYLNENKVKEAENTFIKAKNKNINSESLKGLILVELKKGDRGVTEGYLSQLSVLDQGSANCYASFVYLNDYNKAKDAYVKAKSCNLYGIDKYFASYKKTQNPLYLKLEAINLYYSQDYLNLAEKDILALIKEKDNYRDSHILASKIYEKLGNQAKTNEYKQKAEEIDQTNLNLN